MSEQASEWTRGDRERTLEKEEEREHMDSMRAYTPIHIWVMAVWWWAHADIQKHAAHNYFATIRTDTQKLKHFEFIHAHCPHSIPHVWYYTHTYTLEWILFTDNIHRHTHIFVSNEFFDRPTNQPNGPSEISNIKDLYANIICDAN